MLNAALQLLSEGRSVFPVRVERTDSGFSKRPLSRRPMEKPFTAEELTALWPANANAIGMELGAVSGVDRLDAEGPVPWEQYGPQPDTGCFSSPSGGRGWLVKHVDGVRSDRMWKGSGHAELKLMSDGSFTVVPPSEGYAWIGDPTPAKMPGWMLDRQAAMMLESLCREMRPTDREPAREEVLAALNVIPADDYERWIQVGMALKQGGYELDVWDAWSRTSDKYCDGVCAVKWQTFQKVGRTVSSRSVLYWAEEFGYRRADRHEPITDVGNARVLARIGEGKIAHSASWGWLAYDGKRWAQSGEAVKAVQEMQKEVLDLRLTAATRSLSAHLQTDKTAEDYKKKLRNKLRAIALIRKHEDNKAIEGARQLASSEPLLNVNYRNFDMDPFLLNCYNGTLDLRNRFLRAFSPADWITQLCPTPYDPNAACPRWERFLLEVLGDPDTVAFMQRLLGYCITGATTDHVLPIWYGTGRNGKSTVVRAVLNTLGVDYATTTSSSFLAASKQIQHPTKIADLYGKRFAADLETGDGMKLDEELMKRLTGGDQLKARRMREDFWSFEPTHKLVLATNYEPSVRNQDPAVWGRIRKVPFNACFLGREEKDLDAKLAAEAPGILRWMVEGCYAWQESGLGMPKSVEDATASYKEEQNSVARFFEQMLKLGSEMHRTRKTAITAAYKLWCQQSNVSAVSPRQLGSALKQLGVQDDHSYYHVTLVQ